MPLNRGAQLGPYEILSQIGAGAYQSRDCLPRAQSRGKGASTRC